MDLKVVAVLFCLSVFTISSSQAVIPACCITTRNHIPPKALMMVSGWNVQSSGGACDIDAVILHIKDKKRHICVNPTVFKNLIITYKKEWRMNHWKQKVKKRAAQRNV